MSPAAFRTAVVRVCERYAKRAKTIPEPGPQPGSLGAYERRTTRVLAAEVAALRRLHAPSSEKKLVDEWLATADRLITLLRQQSLILDRDERRVARALAHAKLRKHAPTAEELKHPTAAILQQLYELPAYRSFLRHTATFERASAPVSRRFRLLARKLRLVRCLR